MWALARPGQGCLCRAKDKKSKLRRTRSLQSGCILGSETCGCQEESDRIQADGCGGGLWDGWTHGSLQEDDTRVTASMLWFGVVMDSGSCSQEDGSRWNPGGDQGSRRRPCCLERPNRAHCVSSIRNPLQDPAQAGWWRLFRE